MNASDPTFEKLANELNVIQTWVRLNEVHWAPSKNLRGRLAEALKTLYEILPPLRDELIEAQALHVDEGDKLNAYKVAEAISIVDSFAIPLAAAADCALLVHPLLRHVYTFRWERFSHDIFAMLEKELPTFSKESYYRFIQAVIPNITGESATVEAVKSHIKKSFPVNWGKSPTASSPGENNADDCPNSD